MPGDADYDDLPYRVTVTSTGYVADPDGHLWEIAHNPFSPNDPAGRMTLPE